MLKQVTLTCKSLRTLKLTVDGLITNRILIHAPYGGKEARLGTWRALVEAQEAGQARSIGVSNFGIHHLEELEEYIQNGGGGRIEVGQYELHPWLGRADLVQWLRKRGVIIEAYSPLVRGTRMSEPVLQSLSRKHNKTPAQILIRWSLQMVRISTQPSLVHQANLRVYAGVHSIA